LVEVPKDKQTDPGGRLKGDELGEELVLKRTVRWPIDGGEFEGSVFRGINQRDFRGQRELGDDDVCDVNHGIIPKEEDSPSSTIRRFVSETF
jgi:hypothetical protein